MSFLVPGFFFASLGVAAAIVALHFIVTRQPRAAFLPTARFVPDTRATTVARAKRPSDLRLMLLRVLVVLAAGAGMARPVLTPSRGAEARVILVDVSRSAHDSIAIRDSVRAFYRAGDGIVVFDSSARLVGGNVGDTLGSLRPTRRRGNLSAALIAALRAGSSLRDRADSLELVVVSPFAREEFDAATDSIRKLWPGEARLVTVREAADTASTARKLETNADANDPIAITVGLAQSSVNRRSLIDRSGVESPQPVTSAGGAMIAWPASNRPRFAIPRAVRDTVGGVMAGDAVVVSAFERQWTFPSDSLRGGEVIARWVDGEPAALERPDGAGCVRSVAVPVSPAGDLVIRKDFVRFVSSLSRPCSRITSLVPADPDIIAKLEGSGGLAPRAAFQPLGDARSDVAPWLFALAIAAAIAELFVRRGQRTAQSLGGTGKLSSSSGARAA
jgi:Aerotolerance regulator N-terminal